MLYINPAKNSDLEYIKNSYKLTPNPYIHTNHKHTTHTHTNPSKELLKCSVVNPITSPLGSNKWLHIMHTENIFHPWLGFKALTVWSPLSLCLYLTLHTRVISLPWPFNMPAPRLPRHFDSSQKSTFNTV